MLLGIGLVAIIAIVVIHKDKQHTRSMVDEFIERWPDKCMICSNYNYGASIGATRGPLESHDCIEGNSTTVA